MAQTSAHLKACDIAASETHNKREKELDYVRKDLTHLNESFSYIPHSLPTELASIKREVKAKTGRKLQKNAIPIKEGVVVIEDKTTMEDLKRFCEECRKQFGIIPLQIHIHRDEGHTKSKDWKPNLHAHIVWRMYGEDGKNVRLQREDCAEMQTIAARVLGMERGKKSSKKHLSSLEYKIAQMEKQAEELQSSLSEVENSLKGAFEGAKEGVYDLLTFKAGKKVKEAREKAVEAEKKARAVISFAQKKIAEETQKRADAEQAKAEAEKQSRTYLQQMDSIKFQWRQHQSEINEIESIRSERANTMDLLSDAAEIGLSAAQTLTLVNNRSISLQSVTDPKSGKVIQWDDERPIQLRLDQGRIWARFVIGWEHVTSWLMEALRNPWFKINGVSNDPRRHRGIGL